MKKSLIYQINTEIRKMLMTSTQKFTKKDSTDLVTKRKEYVSSLEAIIQKLTGLKDFVATSSIEETSDAQKDSLPIADSTKENEEEPITDLEEAPKEPTE